MTASATEARGTRPQHACCTNIATHNGGSVRAIGRAQCQHCHAHLVDLHHQVAARPQEALVAEPHLPGQQGVASAKGGACLKYPLGTPSTPACMPPQPHKERKARGCIGGTAASCRAHTRPSMVPCTPRAAVQRFQSSPPTAAAAGEHLRGILIPVEVVVMACGHVERRARQLQRQLHIIHPAREVLRGRAATCLRGGAQAGSRCALAAAAAPPKPSRRPAACGGVCTRPAAAKGIAAPHASPACVCPPHQHIREDGVKALQGSAKQGGPQAGCNRQRRPGGRVPCCCKRYPSA